MSAVLELKPIPGADEAPASPPAQPAATRTIADDIAALIEAAKVEGSKVTMTTLTAAYLKIRDAKKDVDEQAKAKTAPLTKSLDMIEAYFLEQFEKLGMTSVKTEAGTPYKSEKTSVTVADNESFTGWVLDKALAPLAVNDNAKAVIKQTILDSGAFAYMENRASKTAVEAYLEETKELPPGLNRRSEWTVNVRSS